jgi:CheY-like chemotaxis protein
MKHKILVVDDEAEIRKTIRLQLEGTIYEILEAEDGEQGIQILDNENILEVEVIICDVRMPKVNGIEAVAYFRANYPLNPDHRADRLSGRASGGRFHEGRRDRLPGQTGGEGKAGGGSPQGCPSEHSL